MSYLIHSLVKQLGQVEPDPGEVRPEPENPEEPGPGGENEVIEDDAEFDVVDEIVYDDDYSWVHACEGHIYCSLGRPYIKLTQPD